MYSEDNMNCLLCGKEIGQNRKEYCSKKCSNRHWRVNHIEHIKLQYKQYYENNRTSLLEQGRRRRQLNFQHYQELRYKRQEKILEYDTKYKGTHKKECFAHHQLETYVKNGTIKRPSWCQLCGKECKPHGHHTDYDKPLEVIWLCHSCHRDLHNGRITSIFTHPTIQTAT
jgi:hypothetical protein